LSTFLLNVGIGYQVRGIVDNKQVEELARINGDLGRLGGLLKLWLTDDARLASVRRGHHPGGARSDRGHAGPDDSRHAGRWSGPGLTDENFSG
jgi:hypothetical protein